MQCRRCLCLDVCPPTVLLLQGQAFADAQASPEPTLCNAFLEVQSKTVEHLVDAASKLRAVLEGVLVSCLYSDRCRGCAGCIASDLFETAFAGTVGGGAQ